MNNFCMSDTVLGSGDMIANKTGHGSTLTELNLVHKDREQINKSN